MLPVVAVSGFSVWPCWSFKVDEQKEECSSYAIEDL